ncbi:hypothetical protein KVT40_002660 [Elsinoe batatas]|uniref:MFS maltose permease n=1 Tax=Elsinoe batatas TaxID=2601811 RepID=A0A8K0L7A2_9PEZI|nr:hypothetical protein KVT40_002660 [Elsinoe batatas]
MQRSTLTASRTASLLRPSWRARPSGAAFSLRLFTSNHPLLLLTRTNAPRPQLPFLAQPGAHLPRSLVQRQVARVLSTENKQYVREQTVLAAKWTTLGFVVLGLVGFATYSWRCELVERINPSPAEWSYFTRSAWRTAWLQYADDVGQMAQVDWGRVGEYWRLCLLRLEDLTGDGRGAKQIAPQGAAAYGVVRDIGPAAFDVTEKSEAWKAGYAETVMKAALAAEHLQDMVFDRRRGTFYPKATVEGPSNPNPRLLPPGNAQPREEDCEPAFPDPAVLYNRLAYGIGFSTKQRVDAMLAHANWLEFNKNHKAAEEQYQYAQAVAQTAIPTNVSPLHTVDIAIPATDASIIDKNPASATANLVSTYTAQATYLSRTSQTKSALPILLSTLGAVRHAQSHPTPSSTSGSIAQPAPSGPLAEWSAKFFRPDEFPLPLRTGDEPLSTLSQAALKCKEAELMTYIGEILFSTSSGRQNDGLAWTRTATEQAATALRDVAAISRTVPGDGSEKERERERRTGMSRAEREGCRECVIMGLGNWELMAARMEEKRLETGEKKTWKEWFAGKQDQQVQDDGTRVEVLRSGLIQEGLVEPWAFLGR